MWMMCSAPSECRRREDRIPSITIESVLQQQVSLSVEHTQAERVSHYA